MKKITLTCLATLFTLTNFADTAPWQPSSLVVLGDSNSIAQTDGPAWPMYLAYTYNWIASDPSQTAGQTTPKVLNFATKGATILYRNRTRAKHWSTLDKQILQLKHKAPKDLSNTLVAIYLGANDVAEPICFKKPFRCVNYITDNIEYNLARLNKMGAQHVALFTVPDVSKSPRYQNKSKRWLSNVHGLVKYLNANLAYDAFHYAYDNKPFKVLLFETNAFKKEATDENDVDSNGCFIAKKTCQNPDDHYYWNDFNPSTSIQSGMASVMAKMIENGNWLHVPRLQNTASS